MLSMVDIKHTFGLRGNYMNNNIKENGMVGGFREMEKSMNPRVHYKQTREGVSPQPQVVC